MGEFKAGSFKLATKAKVPIVPISINGSYAVSYTHLQPLAFGFASGLGLM